MNLISIYLIIIAISIAPSKNYVNKTSHISLSFNRKFDNENFFEENQKNDLITQIKLDTNSEYIPLLISFNSRNFYCLNVLKNLSYNLEDYISTIKLQEEFKEKENNIKGYDLYKDIILKDGTKIKKINFIHGITKKKINYKGKLGLKLSLIIENYKDYDLYEYDDYEEAREKSNFLMQLMNKRLIYDYIYTIHYTNTKYGEEKGIIYFGTLPHIFSPEKYDINNYVSFYASYKNINILNYYTTYFKDILYGEEDIGFNYAMFDVEYGLMNAPMFFKEKIKRDFLENNTKCYNYILNNTNFYYCDEDVDISKIKPIKFFVDPVHYFVFENKEMFIHKNNKLYFIFGFSFYVNYWRFGTPFFKKYEVVFEHENKQISYYFNNIITPTNKDIKKDLPNINDKGYLKKILIIIFISSFLIVDFILYLYFKCRKKIKLHFYKKEKLIELKQCNGKNEVSDYENSTEGE